MVQKIVFFDTNIWLHYGLPEHIDWHKVVGADHIKIVIHPHSFKELNRVKDSKDLPRLIKKRAATILSLIDSQFNAGEIQSKSVRSGVDIQLYELYPNTEIFKAHGLIRDEGDDCHLAAILDFQALQNSDAIVLVTNDIGLKLRAKSMGISTIVPPAEYRIHPELDPLEKENIELKSEIQTLKNQCAIPNILFKGGLKIINIDTCSTPAEEVEAKERKLLEIGLGDVFDSNIDRSIELRKLVRRIIQIELELHNDGGAPADNVDVFISVHGIKVSDVVTKKELPLYWGYPHITGQFHRYETIWGLLDASAPSTNEEIETFLVNYNDNLPESYSNFKFSVLRTRNGRKPTSTIYDDSLSINIQPIRIKSDILAHKKARKVEPFYLVISGEIKSFKITSKIFCNNLSAPIERDLHVVVKDPIPWEGVVLDSEEIRAQ